MNTFIPKGHIKSVSSDSKEIFQRMCTSNVTLDHKVLSVISCFIEIYTSSESWINKLSIDVWFVMIQYPIFGPDTTIWKSGIWGCKKI